MVHVHVLACIEWAEKSNRVNETIKLKCIVYHDIVYTCVRHTCVYVSLSSSMPTVWLFCFASSTRLRRIKETNTL